MISQSPQTNLLNRFTTSSSRFAVADVVSRGPHATLAEGHLGQIQLGEIAARLECESECRLRITCPLEGISATEQFTLQEKLPGNLRFARRGSNSFLLADFEIDDEDSFEKAMAELQAGVLTATGHNSPAASSNASNTAEELRNAMATCGLPQEQLVEIEGTGQWDLNVQFNFQSIPVRVVVTDGSLRLRRVIMKAHPTDRVMEAVLHRALQLNFELRGSRITVTDEAVYAEARLPVGNIVGPAILEAARAVAAACVHAQPSLELFPSEPQLVECFLEMFSIS